MSSSFQSKSSQGYSCSDKLTYFKTEDFSFIKSSKEYVKLPMTSVIDLNVVTSLICGKRGINESDVNVVKQIDRTLQ